MKKHILTLSFLMLLTSSFAQLQIAVGLKGGLNMANINVNYENGNGPNSANEGKDYKPKFGYHTGVFALFKINQFAVQPEILFSQQGAKMDFTNPNNTDKRDWKTGLTYINIPVLFKYYFVQTGVGDINIQAGPQFGLLQKAETNFYDFDGDGAQSRSGYEDVKDTYKNSDFGVTFGAGLDLNFGLSIDIRYCLSLQNIYAYNTDIKNQILQVSAGYKILKFEK